MKILLLVISLAAFFLSGCNKSDNLKSVDGCPIDTVISNNYLNDAQEIVYQRILSGDYVMDSNQVQFNQQEIDRVLSAIQSVYALHSAQSDSIFNIDKIHTFKLYVLNSIVLQVNINAPEIKNLVNGQPTGNAAFDDLLAKYGFTYNARYPPTQSLPFFNITSNTWYNMQALLPLFKQFSFIQGAQSDGSIGDGNKIIYQINGTTRTLNFNIGLGDCPAGCTGSYSRQFTIDQNCKATFIKSAFVP